MNAELQQKIFETQQASFFRRSESDGTVIVNSPYLGAPIASAFERVVRFPDPAIEVGRMGAHEVHLACLAFDAVRDGLDSLRQLKKWHVDGSINVRYMTGGRC